MIKNLSQLKRAFASGTKFMFTEHYIHPEFNGQTRLPTIVRTNSMYSVVDCEPNHPVSLANEGKGFKMDFGKAGDWKFYENGEIEASHNSKPCFKFVLL